MGIFDNVSNEGLEQEKDTLGGGGLLESDAYGMKINYAYIHKSKSNAMALAIELEADGGGKVREQLYFLSGDAKGNKNYYERDGKKMPLPGFSQANSLCQLTVGKELRELEDEIEDRVIKLYDFDAKEEVPTTVQMVTPLVGQRIMAGIKKVILDKTADQGGGNYQPTGETREANEIDKFFCAREGFEGMTLNEITGKEPAEFINKWLEKNKGNVHNKAKGATGGTTAGAPSTAGAAAAPSKSLFND